MAIFATSRRWLVTSVCAACSSPWSAHRFANAYSSSAPNIGNLRIFCKYRAKLRSGEMLNSNPAPGISYSLIQGAMPKSLLPYVIAVDFRDLGFD